MSKGNEKSVSSLNQIKKSTNVIFNIIFLILGLMCVFPLVFVFSISITSEKALQAGGYHIIPQEFSNAAYMFLWNERGTILQALFMSILIAVLGTVIAVCLTTSMGYVASRRSFKLKQLYTWIIFIPMVFNGDMLASYVVVNNILNLRDTIWAVILPLACSSFSVTICRTFFRTTVPDALIEAAKIDGADRKSRFFHITLPLVKPFLIIGMTSASITAINIFDEIVAISGYKDLGKNLLIENYLTTFSFLDFGKGSALTYIIMLLSAILGFFYLRSLNKEVEY